MIHNILLGLGHIEWGRVAWFYIVVALLGLVFLPLAQFLFRHSLAGPWAYARSMGIILLTFLAWLLGALGVPFGGPLVFGLVGLALVVNGLLLWVHRSAWLETWRRDWRAFAAAEIVFFLLFLAFTFMKAYYPEITGQEKFADFALLNSLLRSDSIPPQDAWFSGNTVNYYFGGHLMAALLTILSGMSSAYTHNLILACWFGLAGVGIFSLGWSLTRNMRYGVLAVVLCLLASNLASFQEAMGMSENPRRAGTFIWEMDMDWSSGLQGVRWASSRVIDDYSRARGEYVPESTINEYPWFAFVHSDLHAHMLVLPFTVLLLGLLWERFQIPAGEREPNRAHVWTLLAVLAVVLGSFIITNLFDFVSYTWLTGVLLLIWGFLFLRQTRRSSLIRAILHGCILVAGALVLYGLFFTTYHMPGKPDTFSYFNDLGHQSPLGQFLLFWGVPLFALVAWLILERHQGEGSLPPEMKWSLAGVVLVLLFLLGLFGIYLTLSVLPLLLGAAIVFGVRSLPPMTARTSVTEEADSPGPRAGYFALGLFIASLAVLWGVEIIHLDETYGKDMQRLNTVFKFYLPVWFWMGLAATYAVSAIRRRRRSVLFLSIFAALIVMVLIFPFFWSIGHVRFYNATAMGNPTLNGIRYIERHQPGEFAAISWLRDNVEGQPVVLETTGNAFSDYARISSNTGLPTVLGWGQHVRLYRGDDQVNAETAARERDIRAIYTAPTLEEIRPLLDKYEVEYIVVGRLERQDFPPQNSPGGLEKFETLPVAFESGNTKIYRVE